MLLLKVGDENYSIFVNVSFPEKYQSIESFINKLFFCSLTLTLWGSKPDHNFGYVRNVKKKRKHYIHHWNSKSKSITLSPPANQPLSKKQNQNATTAQLTNEAKNDNTTISSDFTDSCTLHIDENNFPKALILDHMAISSKDDSCDVNYHNHKPMRTNSDPEDSYYPQYFKF